MPDAVKRVLFFERLQDPIWTEMLTAHNDIVIDKRKFTAPEAENYAALAKAHAYQVTSTRDEVPAIFQVHDDLLGRCPRLLLVCTYGAGYDTVDLEACTRAGVVAVNQAGANKEAVAEHALSMMIAVYKRIGEQDRIMRRTHDFTRAGLMGRNIQGKTLGIIGLGHIGTRMAELCGKLFEMPVLAYDPYLTEQQFRERGARKVSLETLLRQSDIVSIHCPLSQETRGMLGAGEFAMMKRQSILVATSRGGIHDEAALNEALESGHLAGAGLDVWEREPPPLEHPLLARDNVIASPHTAGVTRESRRETARFAAEQILTVFRGEKPPRLLNPEVWPRFVERYESILGMPVGQA
jgi:D-3-phosphoglycerate dehydrogenase / 2-oxoglutarate reductase